MLDYDLFEKYEIGRVPEHVFVRKKEEEGYKNLDQGSIFPEVYYYLLFNSPIRTLPKELILASILNNTGVDLIDNKQYGKALEIFDKIIELDHDDSFFFGGKATALYCMEEYSKAIEICNKVLDAEPELEDFWILKGCAFHNLKEYEKAIEAYDLALHINPSQELAKECREKALSKENLDNFEQMFG
ncbi:MAG: tetratricopeptide repeat protein [Candidatus Aenigmarchaeota archaeon]|nr:tetratricopeptide repeat protein [Candidatus Aenigmarchaeota archaeon]